MIKRIFLFEGWMISVVGALFGIVLGTIFCLLQEYVGIIKLGSNYVVENYPVVTNVADVALVFVTVLISKEWKSIRGVGNSYISRTRSILHQTRFRRCTIRVS